MAEHDNPDLMEEKIKIEEEQQIQEESTEISLVKQEIKEEMNEEIETQITENEENISNVVYEETVIVEEKISKEFGENNGKPQILDETNADLQEKNVDTQNQNENPNVENAPQNQNDGPEGLVNEGEEIEKKEGVPVTENGSVEDLVIPHMDYQGNGNFDAKEGEGHPVEDEKSTVVENGSNGVCSQENKEGKEEEKSSVLDKKDTAKDDGMPPEADGVSIPSHWHEKSGLRIKVIGGSTCEEELMPLFSDFGQVSSIVFDNERKDTAVIRFNSTVSEGEGFLEQVKEKLQNTQFGERTLLIEPFQSESLLFIGNLTPDIDDNALRQMFEKHGHIERAFVLFNAAGRSKCYGFVEYGLKSQAYAAKSAMGNISMDGRVLRVEWSDCRKVADMFSSVLFVDRLPKDDPNVEGNIRTLFSQYGKVRDCHLGLGDNNMFRGFAFVVFFHSVSADKAHEMLDGYCFRGHTIRVSFANPAKSPQSYKLRFGNSSQSNNFANMNRGAHSGMMGANPMRGQMPMQVVGQRYRAPARTGMMQYGRGSHVGKPNNQGHASASGMLVTNTGPSGMMGRPPMNMLSRRANATGGNMPPLHPPSAQGHGPPNPPAIAQVHNTHYRGYETNEKTQDAYQHQYQQRDPNYNYQQQYLQTPQQTYQQVQQSYQQQTQPPYQPQNYQQQSQQHDQSMQPHFQNTQQTYGQYYAQPTHNYSQPQQQQTQQGQTAANYYQPQNPQQEQAVSTQGYAYTQQYNQQYGQPYGAQTQQPGQQYGAQVQQQSAQSYSNTTPQINYPQIQQPSQPPVQTQQSQISYTESYLQPNAQAQVASAVPVANQAGFNAAPPQDSSQQQAYTSYYQPQQPHQNNTQIAYSAQTPAAAGSTQQSLDAQWAAYYASQQTYQQQNPNYVQQNPQAATATAGTRNEQPSVLPDAGQKRTADQMESGPQSQVAYTYPNQLPNQYPQQTAIAAAPFQQTPTGTTTVFQQNTQPASLPGYQLQSNPQTFPNAQAYQQAGTVQGQPVAAAVYDYNKRPRF